MQQYPTLLETPRLTSMIAFDNIGPLGTMSLHKHKDAEFIFVDDGNAEFTIDGINYPISSGDILLLNSGVEHGMERADNQTLKGFSVTFSNLALSELPPGHLIPKNENPVLNVKEQHLTLSRYLEDLNKECQESTPGSSEIAAYLLNALLLKIIRCKYAANTDHASSISEKAKRFMEQNYHIDLSLNDLANHIFVSPYHLSRTFKNDVGVSPIQYLIQYRIEVAKKLLRTTNLSIAEIAYKIGYPNPNYFNLIFKKLTGTSPGKFRKR